MCPICWINGFLALLFGASAFSFGTEWYIVIPSVLLLIYGCYKIWDGIKKVRIFRMNKRPAVRGLLLDLLLALQ